MKPDIYHFGESPLRLVLKDGEPWFVAADVGVALELKNVRMTVQDFPDDERGVSSIYTPSAVQQMTVVNEPGLYRLVFLSRKAAAEKFKKWVFTEVLPAVRRTGSYNGDGPVTYTVGVERVRGVLMGALMGLESGKITIERASVTAKLAGQYLKTWQMTNEATATPGARLALRSSLADTDEWSALAVAAVGEADGVREWPRKLEVKEEEVVWFAVSTEQLAALAKERGLLPEVRHNGSMGRGLSQFLKGNRVPVPDLGEWYVEAWRDAIGGRGWKFSRTIAPVEAAAA